MAIYLLTLLAIHSVLHPVCVARLSVALYRKGDLSASSVAVICRGGVLHAPVLLGAVPALQQSTFKVRPNLTILSFPLSPVSQGFPNGADAAKGDRVELEFAGRKSGFPSLVWQVLVPLAVLVFLLGKPRVSATELIIWHIAIDLSFVQVLHIGLLVSSMRLALRASLRLFKVIPDNVVIGEARISSDDGALLVDVVSNPQLLEAGLHPLEYRLQCMVLLPFSKRLGIDDDLVFLVHRGHAVIALDRALAGGHLGALVIRDVALHFLAPLPLAHPWAVRL